MIGQAIAGLIAYVLLFVGGWALVGVGAAIAFRVFTALS